MHEHKDTLLAWPTEEELADPLKFAAFQKRSRKQIAELEKWLDARDKAGAKARRKFIDQEINAAVRLHLSETKTAEDLECHREYLSERLPELEALFATGKHPEAILECIELSFIAEMPVPKWAQEEFCSRFEYGWGGGLKSWDEVFGRPISRQKFHRSATDYRYAEEIFERIEAERKDRAVDNEMFSEVGRDLGVGESTKVKRLYREARQRRKKR
jgi:hypothetical protein